MDKSVLRHWVSWSIFVSLIGPGVGSAWADPAGSFDAGLEYLPQATTGNISPVSYFMHFRVQSRTSWVRPTFGTTIGINFGTGRVIEGFIHFGLTLSAASVNYVKPFLNADGLFGWANFAVTNSSYNGVLYGFLLGGGVEIRTSTKENATALRLSTGWRFLTGTIGGGLQGSDLGAIQIAVGLTL